MCKAYKTHTCAQQTGKCKTWVKISTIQKQQDLQLLQLSATQTTTFLNWFGLFLSFPQQALFMDTKTFNMFNCHNCVTTLWGRFVYKLLKIVTSMFPHLSCQGFYKMDQRKNITFNFTLCTFQLFLTVLKLTFVCLYQPTKQRKKEQKCVLLNKIICTILQTVMPLVLNALKVIFFPCW